MRETKLIFRTRAIMIIFLIDAYHWSLRQFNTCNNLEDLNAPFINDGLLC